MYIELHDIFTKGSENSHIISYESNIEPIIKSKK